GIVKQKIGQLRMPQLFVGWASLLLEIRAVARAHPSRLQDARRRRVARGATRVACRSYARDITLDPDSKSDAVATRETEIEHAYLVGQCRSVEKGVRRRLVRQKPAKVTYRQAKRPIGGERVVHADQ